MQLARIQELGGKALNLYKGNSGGEHPLLFLVVVVINRPFVNAVEIDVGQQRPLAALASDQYKSDLNLECHSPAQYS